MADGDHSAPAPVEVDWAESPKAPSDAQILSMARERASRYFRASFYGVTEMTEWIEEFLGEEVGDHFDPSTYPGIVRRAIDAELRALADEQATWPPVTDCDRLDQAFDALRAAGFAAIHNADCCSTCAIDQVRGVMDEKKARGGVYYHEQDTEGCIEGGSLFVGFLGARPRRSFPFWRRRSMPSDVEVGQAARNALMAAGLGVVWDGDGSRRLAVSVDWKRRARPNDQGGRA